MKRDIAGGAHRGPVAATRQRRTIRFVQILLVLIAGGLMALAGYSLGRVHGYDAGRRANELDAPRRPSVVQTIVLVSLGGVSIALAGALGAGGVVRLPTPARVDELAGRAESVAIQRAEESATERS